MSLIPFAEKKLIPAGSNDPRIKARIGILHVDAGNAADLWDYFAHRSGGIESHGHIRKDGHLYQYRDTAFQADANLDANDFALSFETQGYGAGEWTPQQLDTIKRVMLWAREVHGIPLRKVTSWNDARGGWGYHTLFGAPSHWTPVSKSCPGPDRKVQFERVLVPWMNSNPQDVAPPEEPDMEPKQIADAPITLTGPGKKVTETTVQGAFDDVRDRVLAGNSRMRDMDAKLDKIIEALGKEQSQP